MCIGNCGCAHSSCHPLEFKDQLNTIPGTNQISCHLAQTESLSGIVLDLVRGWTAVGVLTNTNVTSATGLISLQIVPFVAKTKQPTPYNKPQHSTTDHNIPQQTLTNHHKAITTTNHHKAIHAQDNLPTPVRADRLSFLLSGYDPSIAERLISGFQHGFRLHFQGQRVACSSHNLQSACENMAIVDSKLEKEILAGRIAGPYSEPPFSPFIVSPLGVVPKKAPGEFRMIHHLSFPRCSSVNDGIPADFSSVHYATISDAIQLIKKVSKGCFMGKTDIKNAFRIIPIHPHDYNVLGMSWKGQYYYDKCMPMGCSSSCSTFELFSSALEWIARDKLKINHLIHVLDDFFIVAPTYDLCHRQMTLLVDLCHYLGVPIAPEKTFGPNTVLSFVGIELDVINSEARLPVDKINKCNQIITDFMRRKKVTLKEVQSLVGHLNFACSVIVPGRAFLRRLIDLTIGIKSPHYYIRLKKEAKADLKVWGDFLAEYNCKSFFLEDRWYNSEYLNLYTDASGALGFGAVFGFKWCYGAWPVEWTSYNIAFLEFYPIVLSLFLWGDEMKNRCILFFTDNEALVHVINKQSCKDTQLMIFVRKLVLICLKHNILFKAKHVPGTKNCLADSLSRLQLMKFLQSAPTSMAQSPTEIPMHLLPQNWLL